MRPTLIVLAAGLGSRYGGDKQLAGVGPRGELILEFTAHDAARAGFGAIVLVVRRELIEATERLVGSALRRVLPLSYAIQDTDEPLPGLHAAPSRSKPWGTGHALLCALKEVSTPCGVVNADDWYGPEAIARLGAWLRQDGAEDAADAIALFAFPLGRTLSASGPVNRGVARVAADGRVERIDEVMGLERRGEAVVDGNGRFHDIDAPVSMNCWGLRPACFAPLQRAVHDDIRARISSASWECQLPEVVMGGLRRGDWSVRCHAADSDWCGLTYPADRDEVVSRLARATSDGAYPSPLRPERKTDTPSQPAVADPAQVVPAFAFTGRCLGWERYGNGHINDTFLVRVDQCGSPTRWILQRINRRVFPDPTALMGNVAAVCAHLVANAEHADPRTRLQLLPARDGRPFVEDAAGWIWRCYPFIERTRTIERVTDPGHAAAAARAFARFQKLLASYRGPRLVEVIPGFHDTPARLARLRQASAADIAGRAGSVGEELSWLLGQTQLARTLVDAQASGAVPERITHNDTKINNVLFDERGDEGVCVIDFDTLMPGLSLYDFGDLVRTATATAAEDAEDLATVGSDPRCYAALCEGWLAELGGVLTPAERELMPIAGAVMTFEVAVRFLTDYLEGDRYFKIKHEHHNRIRARNQIAMAKSVLRLGDAGAKRMAVSG